MSERALRPVGEVGGEAMAACAPAARLETLEEVLRWGAHVPEVVVQDEYMHDVIVEHAGVILVFDTT